MAREKTLSIIKPDAVAKHHIGHIIARFEEEGLTILAIKTMHLTKTTAAGFYAVHKGKPFFNELVEFMSSGPIVVMVLEGENAITRNRVIMGATNPKEAEKGSLRALYGESIGFNAVHGSDSKATAEEEIAYFFSGKKLISLEHH